MIALAKSLTDYVSVQAACKGLGISRATYYRHNRPRLMPKKNEQRPSSLALTSAEQAEVIAILDSPRFIDKAPAAIYATLLDEGRYLCSVRTMYRLLATRGEVRDRRRQVQRPAYSKPELMATTPNQLWSWDITKLHGPAKWMSSAGMLSGGWWRHVNRRLLPCR